MQEFIKRLEKLLDNNNIKRKQTAVCTDDTYLIHIFGYAEHCFSIKIATFPQEIICFFGYNEEVILPLNNRSFNKISALVGKAINYGTRMIKICNGETAGIYEFISDGELTPDSALNAYKSHCESRKNTSCFCTLSCSDFRGKNVFEVQPAQ
ncbi:MAG: hypothetical protein ACI4MH_05525 [Candidatus Coproplasma sp.]